MIGRKNILAAAATLTAVAGLGYGMQNGDAVAGFGAAKPNHAQYLSASSDQAGYGTAAITLPAPPPEALLPHALAKPKTPGTRRVAALTAVPDVRVLNDAPTPMFFAGSCEISLTALPEAGAMVRLHLNAPCYPRQRITISHAGLEFADVTDMDGNFSVAFPALNEFAPFAVAFTDGTKAEAKTLKLSLAGYARVAVSWAGAPVLRIHAMEYGAGFGDAGHVWAQAANDAARTDGGFLVQLGNPDIPSPKLAEIYSLYTGDTAKDGNIEFTVEAEVTARTCARDVNGRSFQLAGDGTLTSASVAFSLPACGGENGYLLLNNLFQDLKIASN